MIFEVGAYQLCYAPTVKKERLLKDSRVGIS